MGVWKIYNTKSGKISVVTPFHPLVVAEAKRRTGTFSTITVENVLHKCWTLDPVHREPMEQFCRDLFEGEMIERIITWTADGSYSYYSPTLDGFDLVWFGRDSYRITRFKDDAPVRVIEVLEDKLEAGGSRNNPKLYGSVKVRVRCRAAAEAGGVDWKVEVE